MPKNHDAIPVPDSELFARSVGKFQYTCPNCGQAHPLVPFNWRRGYVFCSNCHVKYQVGVGLSGDQPTPAYLMGKWNSYTANRLDPTGTPYPQAYFYGTLEWSCPLCLHSQRTFLTYDHRAGCEACPADFYVSALFYRLPKVSRLKLRAPFDSIVKGLHEAKTVQPVSAETTDSGSGTPSRSLGDHS